MGHWGWRPGLGALCFCVWISGCTLAWQVAPVPTPAQLPPVTLIVRGREPTRQARPAPAVPASPTSTAAAAAPVEYSVQPGDTLTGIASNYGLELAQLQAANPELKLQFLQVGQRIRIPLTNAAPARESLRLDLSPPDCWPLPTRRLLCLGQVINREERAVADVQLRLRAGAAEGLGSAALRLLPPGVAVPYSVLLPGNAGGPAAGHAAKRPFQRRPDAGAGTARPAGQPGWRTLSGYSDVIQRLRDGQRAAASGAARAGCGGTLARVAGA